MYETTTRKGFSWGYFILGVLFVITGIISFFDPFTNLTALVFVFGAMAIVYGIWRITTFRQSGLRLVAGILDIIIGVLIFVNVAGAISILPYLFAIWFILDSLFRLATVGITRVMGNAYFVLSIILNILGLVVGVLLLFNPITAALTLALLVGIYLLMAGIECIAFAFAGNA